MSVNIDPSEMIMARGQGKRVTCYFLRKPIPDPDKRAASGGARAAYAPLREEAQGRAGAGSPSLGHAAGLAITALRLLLRRVPPGLQVA